MPPKSKITKEQIVSKGLQLIEEKGLEQLNARSLAKMLSCSTQPLFYCFKNMEEIESEIKKAALTLYEGYINEGLKNPKPFLGSGLAYIKFAKEHPNLFRFLYMNNSNQNYDNVNIDSKEDKEIIEETIHKSTGLESDQIKLMHLSSWIFVHGIASMIATKTINYTDDIIEMLLINFYQGMLLQFKKEKNDNGK
ncbi:MAG: TetR/AcrR family transcriptional regulator [Bacilli bacterium]